MNQNDKKIIKDALRGVDPILLEQMEKLSKALSRHGGDQGIVFSVHLDRALSVMRILKKGTKT